MSVRKVAVMGHPVLRNVAAPVPEAEIRTPKIQQLIEDMVDTMGEYDGRGLAAPQIHESVQLVVMLWDFDADKEPSLLCLINPVLKPLTQETSTFWEGCLSLPGLRGKVTRPNRVAVEYLDEKGQKKNFIAERFAATVVQHECDHLMGKLYVDRMSDFTAFAFNREFQRYFTAAEEDSDLEGGGE